MIILRGNYFSEKEDKDKEEEKEENSNLSKLKKALAISGGVVGIGSGIDLLDDIYRDGDISGRVHLYHGTAKKNVPGILDKGILGSKALDPTNPTNTKIGGAGKAFGKKIVYMGKKRSPSLAMAAYNIERGKGGDVLVASVPFEEFKKMEKDRRVKSNPEFYVKKVVYKEGPKGTEKSVEFIKDPSQELTKEEYLNFKESQAKKHGGKFDRKHYADYFDTFSGAEGTSGTRIYEGDIKPELLKRSSKYNKLSLEEWKDYVKKNPKRFLKGVGKTALGVGAVVGGGILIKKGLSKYKKRKEEEKKKKEENKDK